MTAQKEAIKTKNKVPEEKEVRIANNEIKTLLSWKAPGRP